MIHPDLDVLERELKPLAHGDGAITVLKTAFEGLDLGERQAFLNQHLVCDPLCHSDAVARLAKPPEPFHVLQGDIIRTEAAYILGRRQTGNPSFVITTSTCDLVLGRQRTVTLLRVEPRGPSSYATRERMRNDLSHLLRFNTRKYFYLPPLKDDDEDVLFNVVHLDASAQCANSDLPAVQRCASLTLIGWRVLGAMVRSLGVREADEEAEIRIRLASSPYIRKYSA